MAQITQPYGVQESRVRHLRNIHALNNPWLRRFACGVAGAALVAGAGAQTCFEWRSESTLPRSKDGAAYVFDSARNTLVSIGGGSAMNVDACLTTATWELRNGDWQLVTCAGPSLSHAAAAFDPTRGRTVVFGGSARARETWEWDGHVWTIAATTGPSPRSGHAMVFDRGRNVIVLVGGETYSGGSATAQTWEYNGAQWTRRHSATSPSNRLWPAISYDEQRGVTVLFGGSIDAYALPNHELNDTWEWDGTNWTRRLPATPPPTIYRPTMAYDAVANVTRLYGTALGNNDGPALYTWDGTDWSAPYYEYAPLLGESAAMVYDSIAHRPVLVGGYPDLATLERSDGGVWQPRTNDSPRARNGAAWLFDTANNAALVFGGRSTIDSRFGFHDTWTWQSGDWTQHEPYNNPASRVYARMALDTRRGVAVLFGGQTGVNDNSTISDTWEWNGAAWRRAAIDGPAGRTAHLMAFDAQRGVVVMFGGRSADFEYYNGTWEWDGAIWQMRSGGGPSARTARAMAYDVARGQTVLLAQPDSQSNETWLWDGVTWTRAATTTTPDLTSGTSMAYDPVQQAIVASASTSPDDDTPYLWQWNGQNWSPREPLPVGTSALLGVDAAGNPVLFDAVSFVVRSPTDLQITSQPQRVQTHVGDTVELTVDVCATETPTYQWRRYGAPLQNGGRISGALSPTLRIAGAQVSDAGVYEVVVTSNATQRLSYGVSVRVSRIAGDTNCDGAVNNFDVDSFVLALIDANAYAAAFPLCDRQNADGDGDGEVTFEDVDPFIGLLLQ